MSSLTATAPTVKQAPRPSVAFLLGASDAESGAMCLPELFFLKREPVLAYVEGHESVVGETMLSRQMRDICAGNICGGNS